MHAPSPPKISQKYTSIVITASCVSRLQGFAWIGHICRKGVLLERLACTRYLASVGVPFSRLYIMYPPPPPYIDFFAFEVVYDPRVPPFAH